MLLLTSPAKTLDWETAYPDWIEPTLPLFLEKTVEVARVLKRWKMKDFMKRMKISEDLAQLNFERIGRFEYEHTKENSRPALWAYKGDIMREFDLLNYGRSELEYAQNSLRFISGLYGYLRPFDLMQPYRLEMKIRMGDRKIDELTTFWKETVREGLNMEIEVGGHQTVINLASVEYGKAVDWKKLRVECVVIDFMEYQNGRYEMVGIFAKKARGMMVDWCIRNRIEKKEDIRLFEVAGYEYVEHLSTKNRWVFGRGKK